MGKVFVNIMKTIFIILLSVFILEVSFSQVISQGATWKYLDDGTDQGTKWRNNDFNDSNWAEGKAQLGFGDGDEMTVLNNNSSITYYFRKTFNVTDFNVNTEIKLDLLCDDGAIVYFNGKEVQRLNMPSGTIDYLTIASSAVSGSDKDIFNSYIISSTILTAGLNTIAIEIHQSSATSSDISFDLRMSFDEYQLFRKAPYLLYSGENDKMLILWQLQETRICDFEWGEDDTYSTGFTTTEEFNDSHQHKIILSELIPDTKYFYKVTLDSLYVKTGNFKTGALDTEDKVSFYAYGDTRTYPSQHNLVAKMIMKDIQEDHKSQTFIVSSGDMVSNGDVEEDWDNQFFDPNYEYIQQMLAQLPYLCAVGNHESQGLLYSKYFPFPMFISDRYYYSFDYGTVHFTVVDQYTSYSDGSTQYNWLVNDLASSDKPWKIILLHEPGWSAGGGHSNNLDVQNIIQPLCLAYGVRFVLSGHNHYYARAVKDEVMHITTGGGGAPLHTPELNAENIVKTDKSHHYCKLEIDYDVLTFTAKRKDSTIIETFDYQISIPYMFNQKHMKSNDGFNVYSKENLIYVMNKNNLEGYFTVYDNFGRKICQKDLSGVLNNVQIDNKGVYFVRINIENSFNVKKVIVK
ncbi:MAG: metallophosphoesterase [Bacteroidales bacterium]|nr:metallophosphoesterase [Bacteroidales bacterium]